MSRTLAHFCRVACNCEDPDSQVSDRELASLLRYSRNARCIVEIGCFEGKTTAALAKNTPGIVFSVDPFHKGRAGIAYGFWIARLYFRRRGVRNAQLVRGFSFDVAQKFVEPIDFLFIDGDHSYQGITRDWADWFPKLRVGGFVALHDCKKAPNSGGDLGTMRFYRSDLVKITEIDEVESVDSLVIFKRNE